MNNLSIISPNFQGTKKTIMGNEYEPTSKSKRIGGLVGLLAGSGYAYLESRAFKGAKKVSETLLDKDGNKLVYRDLTRKRSFIRQMNDLNLTLNSFGKVGQRNIIKNGLMAFSVAIAASGMFVGAMIGKAFDSHNNHKLATQADEKAQSSK